MGIGLFGGTIAGSGALSGGVDCHSHVLPGVDDGFVDVSQSLDALLLYELMGLRCLWLTPHIMEEWPNETEELRRRFGSFRAAYSERAGGCPVELRLSAEYMLDSLFLDRLSSGDLLPFLGGGHLLVETSYYSPPLGFSGMLSAVIERGFTPVLAHPERYSYMSMADYRRILSGGVVLQLDIFSLLGWYGREPERKSRELLQAGMYSLAGSDIHDISQLALFSRVRLCRSSLKQLLRLMEKQKEEYEI